MKLYRFASFSQLYGWCFKNLVSHSIKGVETALSAAKKQKKFKILKNIPLSKLPHQAGVQLTSPSTTHHHTEKKGG